MPVSVLLCEGRRDGLDATILSAVCPGPRIRPAESKAALGPKVDALDDPGRPVRAIRDRDFDYDVTAQEALQPFTWSSKPIGWVWSRHEIENYAIDPVLVGRAFAGVAGFDEAAYRGWLAAGARIIADYQAARWALGRLRRRVERDLGLRRLPDRDQDDFELPGDLSRPANQRWALEKATVFAEQIGIELGDDRIQFRFEEYAERFSAPAFAVDDALRWFSGKDLLASVHRAAGTPCAPWWPGPRGLLKRVREWIRANPEDARALVAEWAELKRLIDE